MKKKYFGMTPGVTLFRKYPLPGQDNNQGKRVNHQLCMANRQNIVNNQLIPIKNISRNDEKQLVLLHDQPIMINEKIMMYKQLVMVNL